MKKLTDAQVVTLMFIMVEEPAPPADFTRFPAKYPSKETSADMN